MGPGDEIRRGGPEDLRLLEPLWVSVHHARAASMPELAPYVDDALVGYGLAHVMSARETWAGDTWVTGPRIGEIESLAVLPAPSRPRARVRAPRPP